MKELHKIAWASYHAGPEIVRDKVWEFFQIMASDDINHKVKLHEFLAFTKKEGFSKISNPKFFEDLIFTEGNDYIGFWEIVTLYYILVSRRPFCDGCGNFIEGAFFTCGKCFHCKNASFNICISCFEKKKYKHEHKDQFLDNVLLLELSRKPECRCCKASPRAKTMKSQPSAGTSNELVSYNPNNPSTSQQAMNSQSSSGTSNQLVPYNPNNSLVKAGILWSIVSSVSSTVASLAGCCIM